MSDRTKALVTGMRAFDATDFSAYGGRCTPAPIVAPDQLSSWQLPEDLIDPPAPRAHAPNKPVAAPKKTKKTKKIDDVYDY